MSRKISDLREMLFDAMELLKAGKMDIETAKQMANIGQTIVNSAVAESKHLARQGGHGTGFIFDSDEAPVKQLPPREVTLSEHEKVMKKYL